MTQRRSAFWWLYRFKRWMYRTGRPGLTARVMNRISAIQFAAGFASPRQWVTIEVRGRRSDRIIAFPAVLADYDGRNFLVSMLGEGSNWVANVRAAGGRAVLRRGRRRQIQLREVEPADRAPILRRYLAVAPGARAHMPVNRDAPIEEFERVANQYPVFEVLVAESHVR